MALHWRQACLATVDDEDVVVDDVDVVLGAGGGGGCSAAIAAAAAAALSLWTLCKCSRRTLGDGKPLLHSQHFTKYSATTSWRAEDPEITEKYSKKPVNLA